MKPAKTNWGRALSDKFSPTGNIGTKAGNGFGTFAGDGGPATSASLSFPNGVAVDSAKNIYISDQGNQRNCL